MRDPSFHPRSALAGAGFLVLLLLLVGMRSTPRALTSEQERILSHMSLREVPDGQGGMNQTLVISAVNVQIVNGQGATETTNGVGNLIVGYDELGPLNAHTGSHNLVGGSHNGYTSHGGLVVGFDNTIAGAYASVSGGSINHASGAFASISGGILGLASGLAASIGGGKANDASGDAAAVAGGWLCRATGDVASVAGGLFNTASGSHSAVSGGEDNAAADDGSTVSGGCSQDSAGGCDHVP
jgi:hypothetical protein